MPSIACPSGCPAASPQLAYLLLFQCNKWSCNKNCTNQSQSTTDTKSNIRRHTAERTSTQLAVHGTQLKTKLSGTVLCLLAHSVESIGFRCYDQLLDADKDQQKVQKICHIQHIQDHGVRGYSNVQDIRMLYLMSIFIHVAISWTDPV